MIYSFFISTLSIKQSHTLAYENVYKWSRDQDRPTNQLAAQLAYMGSIGINDARADNVRIPVSGVGEDDVTDADRHVTTQFPWQRSVPYRFYHRTHHKLHSDILHTHSFY